MLQSTRMHRYWLVLVLASGCIFRVGGVDTGGGGGGDGDAGSASDDLAGGGGGDVDMAGAAASTDMAGAMPDLLPLPLALSHLPQHYLGDGKCDPNPLLWRPEATADASG